MGDVTYARDPAAAHDPQHRVAFGVDLGFFVADDPERCDEQERTEEATTHRREEARRAVDRLLQMR